MLVGTLHHTGAFVKRFASIRRATPIVIGKTYPCRRAETGCQYGFPREIPNRALLGEKPARSLKLFLQTCGNDTEAGWRISPGNLSHDETDSHYETICSTQILLALGS